MDTQIIRDAPKKALRRIVTYSTGEFIELSKRHGVTPETLALIALQFFITNAPDSLNLIANRPLIDRPCCECELADFCESAKRKDRGVCFL